MKKLLIFTFLVMVTCNWLFAQNADPVVENVTAVQRSDNSMLVDIYYDVNDADGDDLYITLQISNDNGATYDVSCFLTSGDIGSGITSGTGKQIIWDLGNEHPNQQDEYIFKVAANDGVGDTCIDIDGNVYQTVQIGNQLWMAENLKVTHYRNGDPIPNVTDNSVWSGLSTGAYCYYDNNPTNGETYGALYNGYAVDDSRNIAPEGWHVPTDEEIKQLEMTLGMNQNQADAWGWRGTNEGSKLAGRSDLWSNHSLENDPEFDTSGFCLLPSGMRNADLANFSYLSINAHFWSSTENSNDDGLLGRGLYYHLTQVSRSNLFYRYGYSVRCVRD
ncbi:MAG: fibrobacter succinogenes major paralogous domain-containing protein [Candidatus Cloacimonetes bacterium]|nr:fibrobacter succinogenes major paralogous domain-containing protein [Candidatus Cloacimonadota bacterium]